MIDSYTGKKITKAMGSIWPAPAVQYHMASGRVARVSFWAPSKATPQELVERGVLVACSTIYYHGTSRNDRWNTPYSHADRIVALYVENKAQPGAPWHVWQDTDIDPWAPPALGIPQRKPAIRKADWQDALRELLKVAELNGSCPRERYAEAREVAQRLIAA